MGNCNAAIFAHERLFAVEFTDKIPFRPSYYVSHLFPTVPLLFIVTEVNEDA